MQDVIVVGGGPAGALVAALVARAGVRVRIFERARFPRHKLCGDTLNPGALRVLARHMPVAPILERGLALHGMLVSGPGGVAVRGTYGAGLTGRSISRHELDMLLVNHAVSEGAAFDDGVGVLAPVVEGGAVTGVTLRTRGGTVTEQARLVIAADGRESRLARALDLAHPPRSPRRWAIGAYFEGVDELGDVGEMHVRRGHYIGVAPLPGGLANACLVLPRRAAAREWGRPIDMLTAAIARDRQLAPRFCRARPAGPVHVLGPTAVDAVRGGVPGLLTAGDAAGFIDPMTGDGLRLALAGATLTAGVALDVITGRLTLDSAPRHLDAARRAAFAAKWRFNRTLRTLVGSASGVTAGALAARLCPAALDAIIRYAGDCDADLTVRPSLELRPMNL